MKRAGIGPSTRLCALLGAPVAHSGSPAMHNAAFAATGRDARYLAFHVEAADFATAVRGLAALGAIGANVTVPHKERALAVAATATARAQRAGAANVLSFRDGRILADNTDGEGFVRALQEAGHELAGRALLLLGAGGAARAVVTACLDAGARVVYVANRSPDRAAELARACDAQGRRVIPVAWQDRERCLAEVDAVVNATSLGLKPDDPSPLAGWSSARPGTLAVDLIYARHETAFLAQARGHGLSVLDGRGMLVWQAALSWQCWFGEMGPVDVMADALDRFLGKESV